MSHWQIEDEGWKAIMADPQLARARSKLSMHELRLIVRHARLASGTLASGGDVQQAPALPSGPARDSADALNDAPSTAADAQDDAEWLRQVTTGTHSDVTLHSGTALIRLERIASRLSPVTSPDTAGAK
jgi:hypothetical protein